MLKVVTVDQVRVGMFIHEIKGAWVDHPFWQTKFVLKSEEDIQKLRASRIKKVVIDICEGLDVAPDEPPPLPPAPASPPLAEPAVNVSSAQTPAETAHPTTVSLQEESERASKIIHATRSAVASMFQDIRLGKTIDTQAVMPFVDEIAESVTRNTHALISLVRLKTVDDYTYMHSVAVCALMTALAKELGMTPAEIRQAGMAGMLHDMGKAKVPTRILNKPGALSDTEFHVIRQHPAMGHALLLQANINDPVTLDVCLHHHEKIDGSGYPDGMLGEELSVFAKMSAICDVYDAVTSVRAYKAAWEPGLALKRMASWSGHFDPVIFKAFVKSLGIYPIGTVLLLKSGRLAVVVEQTQSLLRPIVKVFFSTKSHMHLEVERLDLSVPGLDEIVSLDCAANWGISNIEHLWAAHA